MPEWKIAVVQMDCRLADKAANLATIVARLRETAAAGAKLVVFPECAVTGYCFENKAEGLALAEPMPGPSIAAIAEHCMKLGLWAVVGLLEKDGECLYNVCALIGPGGFQASYRKTHLPCVGIDRFTTPGEGPFTIHDLGGLRIGMNICYDGSFPEPARVLMLLGADLVVLPTNWAVGAMSTVEHLIQARALENQMYYAACNRIGEERGFQFFGHSRIVDINGDLLAASSDDRPAILYASIDPARARNKHIVRIPEKYELHRTRHRRPDLYGLICKPLAPEDQPRPTSR
jgi:5-aminopentanamidase